MQTGNTSYQPERFSIGSTQLFHSILNQFKKMSKQAIQIYIDALTKIKQQLQKKTKQTIHNIYASSCDQKLLPTRDYISTTESSFTSSIKSNSICNMQVQKSFNNKQDELNKSCSYPINQQPISLSQKLQNLQKILNTTLKIQDLEKKKRQSQKSIKQFSLNKYLFVQDKNTYLFYMDLVSKQSLNIPDGLAYFSKIQKVNKFLIHKVKIGQMAKLKKLEGYFKIQWESLKQIELKRKWNNEYYTEHGLKFIGEINLKRLKKLVLKGNFLSLQMIKSFQQVKLPALEILELNFERQVNQIDLKYILASMSYNQIFKINLVTNIKTESKQSKKMQEAYGNKIILINRQSKLQLQNEQISRLQKLQVSTIKSDRISFQNIIPKQKYLSEEKNISDNNQKYKSDSKKKEQNKLQLIKKQNKQVSLIQQKVNIQESKRFTISSTNHVQNCKIQVSGTHNGDNVIGRKGDDIHNNQTIIHNHNTTYQVVEGDDEQGQQSQQQIQYVQVKNYNNKRDQYRQNKCSNGYRKNNSYYKNNNNYRHKYGYESQQSDQDEYINQRRNNYD